MVDQPARRRDHQVQALRHPPGTENSGLIASGSDREMGRARARDACSRNITKLCVYPQSARVGARVGIKMKCLPHGTNQQRQSSRGRAAEAERHNACSGRGCSGVVALVYLAEPGLLRLFLLAAE